MIDYASDPLFWQRFLASAGLYKGQIDGAWGPISKAAAQEFEASSAERAEAQGGSFDPRSESNIQTLLPKAQTAARNFLGTALALASYTWGVQVRITSGTRTFAEQHRLYEQGRTQSGPIVTHADRGQSNHNFGVAWDITLFSASGDPIWESPYYLKLAQLGKSMGLVCGAFWTSFQDEPHYQIVDDDDLASIAKAFEAGQAFV